jgi:hypothetical protein
MALLLDIDDAKREADEVPGYHSGRFPQVRLCSENRELVD